MFRIRNKDSKKSSFGEIKIHFGIAQDDLFGAGIPIFIVGAQTLQLSKSAKRLARDYAVADFIVNGGFKGIIAHFTFPKMPHGVFITIS